MRQVNIRNILLRYLIKMDISLSELFLGDYISLDSLSTPLNKLSLREQLEVYQKELESKISNHDQEIEQMCSEQYKSFIDCIQELLLVRPSADGLKQETVDINTELIKSADTLQRKAEELIKARKILVNSSQSIELITKCIFVLEEYSKFNYQLQEKKYFPALKTLESLDTEHLPSVSDHKFAQSMRESIPKYRLEIKEATTKDLNDFLEGLLVKSQEIGQTVLNQQNLSFLNLIDFCPLYRGLHIFSNLGFREEYKAYYKEQRQKQSKLAFHPPSSMSQSILSYEDYFSSVVGFFVIEDHLMSTTKDFVDPEYLQELWRSCIQSMIKSMEQQAKQCHNASLMLEIKKKIMVFISTIGTYGHKTDDLGAILVVIRKRYNHILMSQWKENFEEIFRTDNYHPLEVKTMEEYLEIVGRLSFFKSDGIKFPKKFPFSLFVPKIYDEIRAFVEQSLKFSQDLNSSKADVEDMVRSATNQLLVDVLGPCLTNLINNSNLELLQLIQITINTDFLEEAMQSLDNYIKHQVKKSMSGFSEGVIGAPIKLQGESMFKDARADAESQIYKKINDKIDEFFSLASYDWTLSRPNDQNRHQASSFITDIISFLNGTFKAFTNLPPRIAQGACMSACKHVAQSLRDMLLAEENKFLSMDALVQFELDLIQCEMFANSEPVKGFKEGDLLMVFAELRQICDLFLRGEYSNYIRDMGKQQNKYLRVTTATALNICEKIRRYDRKKNFMHLKKTDKQKLFDSFIESLRQQSAIQH